MPIFKIQHITQYDYDRHVKESVSELKIFTYHCAEQETLLHELDITSQPDLHYFNDYWGNRTAVFNILPAHNSLTIASRLVVRTIANPNLQLNFISTWGQLQKEVNNNLQLLELVSCEQIKSQDVIDDIAQKIYQPWKSVASVVQECNQYIYQHFQYIKGITSIETTIDEILQHRSGVCQDFAHVMLQVLRTLKIPCRYVSGYICPNKNGMRGVGATHAWVEAWIPEHGWAGIDPTNNIWVTNTHVKLAVGRNFSDCTPVKGTFKGPAKQSLSVIVSVGYEDGNVFEDSNKVKTMADEMPATEVVATEGMAAQQ
jgi:transglutaminase-like putative cysteine protease